MTHEDKAAREEFIALLATVWPDTRRCLANGMSLPRLCMQLATDAFVKQPDAPAVLQRLREELQSLYATGAFTWGRSRDDGREVQGRPSRREVWEHAKEKR